MMTNLDHTLIRLADYPLLLALASKQTSATRLDGRACRYLYANATIDTATVSAHELDLIVALGVQVNQHTDMLSQLLDRFGVICFVGLPLYFPTRSPSTLRGIA